MKNAINVIFVPRPHKLPHPPKRGRTAVLDLAFAFGADYDRVTAPFIQVLQTRLAVWIDHHDHPMWSHYQDRDDFVLVSKLTARACPQLVTPELVQRVGPVDHILAHADFDGCLSAAKYCRGGEAPYAEADEDARFSDAPGHGFVCSARGQRLCDALDEAQSTGDETAGLALLHAVMLSLRDGTEDWSLTQQLDALAQDRARRVLRLETMLSHRTCPHPDVTLLDVAADLSVSDKKFLLRQMEESSRVAIVRQGTSITVATFCDAGPNALNLGAVEGLKGQAGFAWTPHGILSDILPGIVLQLQKR